MKLWKIMLAVIVAVLMISCVAMADDEHECQTTNFVLAKGETCKYVQFVCNDSECPLKNNKVETGAVRYEHDWKAYAELTTAATCTKDGQQVEQCRACEQLKTTVVKATGHTLVYEPAKTANCIEEGYTEHRKCSVPGCGYTELKNVVAKNPYNHYGNGERHLEQFDKAPTCTENGYAFYYCDFCQQSRTVTVWTAGHTWAEKDVPAKNATCTEDGYTAHKICTVCKATFGKNIVPASGAEHEWKKTSSAARAATCTKFGYSAIEKCENCGEKRYIDKVEKLGHDYTLKVDELEPTCTAKGWVEMQCSRCDETKKYDVAQLAHNWVENGAYGWQVRKAATCYANGVDVRFCTYGCKTEETRVSAMVEHKLTKEPTMIKKNPTCEKEGEGIKYCTNAGCDYQVTVAIKALGHDIWVEELKAADCENPGIKNVWCDREKKILEQYVIIPAKGHKGTVIENVAATCTKEGYKTTKCENCGEIVTETIAKIAHDTKEVVAKPASCGVEGTMNIVCTVCDATVGTKAIDALKHDYEWKVITAPSAAGNGRNEYKCNNCGDVADVKTVKYTKYYYNNTMTGFGPMTRELVGGNDWYRVTPVDVTVDGVYTYDLIASNKYVVGTVTISVNAGTLTVSYKVKGNVDVKDESLLIYASKADLAAGSAVTAPVGAAINVAETFGADGKVLVSLILTGDYDAAGKDLVNDAAAAGMIANID